MNDKLHTISSSVIILAFGIGLGAFGVYMHFRVTAALQIADRTEKVQQNLIKDLNEKALPTIQKDIEALQKKKGKL